MPEAPPAPGRVYGGLSDEQRRLDRRERLIAAGLQLYGTQGYSSTTIEQISREARVTARHFYESFGSQRELFEAVFERVYQEADEAVAAAINASAPEPVAMIRAALTTLIHHLVDDERRGRVVCVELYTAPGGHQLGTIGSQRLTEIVEFYGGILVELGYMDAHRLQLRAVAVAGALRDLIWHGLFATEPAPLEEIIEVAIEIFERIAGDD